MNLLENYKGRLAVSEKYYAQKNQGSKMSNNKKMITAMCLDNTAKFINESFKIAAGTQRADLGMYKNFVMDITALTVPNLIVQDIFMTVPMQAITGYLTFMQYALGEPKGFEDDGSAKVGGELEEAPFTSAMSKYDQSVWNVNNIINSPLTGLGKMTPGRERYSSQRVVETLSEDLKLAWTPVVKAENMDQLDSEGNPTEVEVDATGKVVKGAAAGDKIRYIYDNVYIPQDKLPSVVARMTGIALTARARKLAIEYDTLGAFQAKTDYGLDFESTIAQQAQAELEYEIDSEAVFLVKEAGDALGATHKVEWIDEELDTISYSMKAEGFARKLEQAKMIVYKATNKFLPNWILVSPDVMPILTFVKGFEPAANAIANGPYVAGTVSGMKVIVSPILGEKVCYLGVLGNDGKTAVGVFAPYMPIVPSQLLQFADFRNSQGFATMYDMKIINPLLLAKIEIKDGDQAALYKLLEEEV